MKCPHSGSHRSRVISSYYPLKSRLVKKKYVRCQACGWMFKTIEKVVRKPGAPQQ